MNAPAAPAVHPHTRTSVVSPRLDALVIGGGLAGASAAIELARAGARVAIVERAACPHDKVCGEFLSCEAVDDLLALGVDVLRLGGIRTELVRATGRVGRCEAALPFPAVSLTRRALDEALLSRAEEAGALVLRGRTAEGIVRSPAGWCAEVTGPERSYALEARDIFLATGKHDLRGLPRPAGQQPDLIAFKMHLHLTPAQAAELGNAIELTVFNEGYGGLQLVEGGVANLCCVVRKRRLRALGGVWASVLDAMRAENPLLRRRTEGAEPLFGRALAIGAIPYGFLRRDAIAEGVWAIGDQAVVIPSFTGDGMALALHSGRLAARTLVEGSTAHAFQQRLYAQVRRQVRMATLISRAMVSRALRPALELLVPLWPGSLRALAASTRLPQRHRLSAPQHIPTAA